MTLLEFIASVVGILAWPVVGVAVVLMLRPRDSDVARYSRRHDWQWGRVTDPQNGPNASIPVHCDTCGEDRSVWVGMAHNPPTLAYGCPGRRRSKSR